MIHSTAIVETDNIGEGTQIWRWTHVCKGARIGKNCKIGAGVYIGPGVLIGAECKVQNNVFIPSGVQIGNNVFIGPHTVFTNVKRPNPKHPATAYAKTWVFDEAVIGANCTIVCGVTIQCRTFVGAGSVVTKDVLTDTTVVGNPARIKGGKA